MQSLAADKAGKNPFYMHNSAYTRTDAFFEPVENDYTAFVPFPKADNTKELNLPLIIGLSVAGGVLLIGGIVAIIIIVLKKKKV